MNNDHTNPNMRRARAFFKKDSGSQAKTIPLNRVAPMEPEPETPTLPMPGMPGLSLPDVPFTPQSPLPEPHSSFSQESTGGLGPVVGWLVILSGPGRGRSLELGYGRNSIGRGRENEVCLPYGDRGISELAHAFVAYDYIGRKAYLADGNSRNLVYLNGAPSFGTVEIQSGCVIGLGGTKLMFVAFCSREFDWKDNTELTD